MRKMPGLLLVMFCTILLFSMTACASGTDDGKPTMTLGYLPITHSALPLILEIQNQGEFETFRLEMIKFSNWAEMAEAIQAGKIDGGGSILNTLAVKIAANDVPFQTVLMSHREGNVFIVSRDINDVSGLRGKTIAIPSRFSPHYIILSLYLEENGLQPGVDVIMPDMAPPDMVQALANGSIDGFVVAEPFGVLAEELGVANIMFLSKDVEIPGTRSNGCTISLREGFIEDYPDALQEFVDELVETGIWVEGNPQEAAELLQPFLGQQPETIVRSFNEPPGRTLFVDLYPRVEEYELLQDQMIDLGLIEDGIDMDWFIEERFAEAAYQKLDLQQMEW